MLQSTKAAKSCIQSQANEAIANFFNQIESVELAEDVLFEMLSDSLSNPTVLVDSRLISTRMFLYRELKNLIEALDPEN